ncbi:hypothetical protein DXG01_013098 [Tephrocybe rancida]|nr:hypothetical protein DXG01_013098 [Tephrocybe rancida]
MISVKYTLLLVTLAFGSVPEAWAAPVGTRSVNVKAMRRMEMEREHMRRSHHSATSFVQRDVPVAVTVPVAARAVDIVPVVTRGADPVPVVAREADPVPVLAREADPAPVVAREADATVAERHEPHVTSPTPTPTRMARRHHAKNEARGSLPLPRELPRFKRDEVARRKTDATDANIARNTTDPVKREPAGAPQATSTPVTKEKRDPSPSVHSETVAQPAATFNPKDKRNKPEPMTSSVDPLPTPTPDAKDKREPAPEPSVHENSAQPKPTPDAKDKREPVPAPELNARAPVRPIVMFRRALAFEDLD